MDRPGWRLRRLDVCPWLTVVGPLATGWLSETASTAPILLQVALVAVVTALIGLMRLVTLRWLFHAAAPTRARTAFLSQPRTAPLASAAV